MLLAATAILGGCLGALLSHVPGKRKATALSALLLTVLAPALFFAGLWLRGRSRELLVMLDSFFPDRLSKLAGCGLLLLLGCGLGLLTGFLRCGGVRRYFRLVSGSRFHRRLLPVLPALGFALVLGCALLAGDAPASPVKLSELCCANFTLLADPDTGSYDDYLELLNTGSEPVELEGYFLSDNGKKRNRFRLPARALAPGETVLIWADGSGKSGRQSGEDIHLNFSLKPGDTLWFSSPSGVLLQQVLVPERKKNISLTLLDGAWILAKGTPGEGNAAAVPWTAPALEAPVFSLPSGFYDEPQLLTLSAAPGCEIRYTLDGALPTVESPLYEAPLYLTDISGQPNRVLSHPTTTLDRSGVVEDPVDKGSLIRAAAFGADGARSETVTAVYFVGKERFAQYEGRRILNITAAPQDLFGNYGICVTGLDYDRWLESGGEGSSPWPCFYARGPLAERDAEIALWDENHETVMEEACGIRLQGSSSRTKPFKRFRLIAREIYGGSKCFSAPIFGDSLSHSFFTWGDSADIVTQRMAEGLGLGGLDALSASVFVNGEYYYDTWLRDHYDEQYFQSHFGVKSDELILIGDNALDEGRQEDYEDYLAFMDYVAAQDCADPQVWAEICAKMDVRNYAEYVALNIYCNNTDWSIYKNYKLWRTRKAKDNGYRDGRWRWLVYDMDSCAWSAAKYGFRRAEFDAFQVPQPYTKLPFLEMPLFADLLKNPEFRSIFVSAWLDLSNAVLRPEKAQRILDKYEITDGNFWVSFFRDRPVPAAELLIRDLQLDGAPCGLELRVSDPAGGSLRLDGYPLELSEEGLSGTWITGVPLTLSAEPAPGWRFTGWAGSVESGSSELSLTPEGELVLTAVFERK